MSDDRQPCDDQVDVDDSTWFECELPMHHPGPHKYTFTWENEPYGPQLPRTSPPMMLLPEAWAESVMASRVTGLRWRLPAYVAQNGRAQ